MTTRVRPYCQIHGYEFTDIMFADGLSPSGGELGVEEITPPGGKYGDVRAKGRQPKKYRVRVGSDDRELIEIFLKEVNTAPEDAPFYPFDAERRGLIASAYAVAKPELYAYNWYEAEAVITCREPWLYGPDKGIDFEWYKPIPAVSDLLTNVGQDEAPINYMQISGDYVSGSYLEGLSVRITPCDSTAEHDRELVLCDKLLRGDVFELGYWKGEVYHSYETDFSKIWSAISTDLHGKTSGGTQTDNTVTLDDGDYMMIPFHGPLPISGHRGSAMIELTVDAISGTGGAVQVAYETSLSDMAEVNHDDLVVGENTIYIDCEGRSHVAIGIKADIGASNGLTLSRAFGKVKRYVPPKRIPALDIDESGKIRVESTAGTQAAFLQVVYNDRYYY